MSPIVILLLLMLYAAGFAFTLWACVKEQSLFCEYLDAQFPTVADNLRGLDAMDPMDWAIALFSAAIPFLWWVPWLFYAQHRHDLRRLHARRGR